MRDKNPAMKCDGKAADKLSKNDKRKNAPEKEAISDILHNLSDLVRKSAEDSVERPLSDESKTRN